jgi:hypothetical protein
MGRAHQGERRDHGMIILARRWAILLRPTCLKAAGLYYIMFT